MADDFSVSILYKPTVAEMDRLAKEVERVSVLTARTAARLVVAQAKAAAPVYAGPRKDVPKGRLKRSIKAGRVRMFGSTAIVRIKPTGWPAQAYAPQEEGRQPFMQQAYAAVAPEFLRLNEEAWAKVIASR